MSQSRLEVLQSARDKIDQGWIQGRLHESELHVWANNRLEVRDGYCAVGAITAATGYSLFKRFRAEQALRDEIPYVRGQHSIVLWNDTARDKQIVLAGFDRAIAAEKERVVHLHPLARRWDRHYSKLAERARARMPKLDLATVISLQQVSQVHRSRLAGQLAEQYTPSGPAPNAPKPVTPPPTSREPVEVA